MYNKDKRYLRGFTLIELSIVIVIIGLIVGGVLVGRDLIHSAQIRKTITQIENFNTATNAFKLKYRCLPGDCTDPEGFGLESHSPGFSGNGDGTIGWCNISAACSDVSGPQETWNFWYHLHSANLVSSGSTLGNFSPTVHLSRLIVSYPGSPHGPDFKIVTDWGVRAYMPYSCELSGCSISNEIMPMHNIVLIVGSDGSFGDIGGTLVASDLRDIDRKIDDGFPVTGQSRAFTGARNAPPFVIEWIANADPLYTCLTDDNPPQYTNAYPPSASYPNPGSLGCGFLTKASF